MVGRRGCVLVSWVPFNKMFAGDTPYATDSVHYVCVRVYILCAQHVHSCMRRVTPRLRGQGIL